MSAIAAGANAMETATASAVSGVRQRRRGFICFGLPLLRMFKFLSFLLKKPPVWVAFVVGEKYQ
jgi:hypothetical protein